MAEVLEDEQDTDEETVAFLSTLSEELKRVKTRNQYKDNCSAFVHWSVQQISPAMTDNEIRAALAPRGTAEISLDAAWFDRTAMDVERVKQGVFFAAKGVCPEELITVEDYDTEILELIWDAYEWLTDEESKVPKGPQKQLKDKFQNLVIESKYPCRLAVLIPGKASEKLRSTLREYSNKIWDKNHSNISIDLYDLSRLYSLFVNRLESVDMPIPNEVRFKLLPKYYIRTNGGTRALVGEIPLSEVYSLVDNHGLALFAKNLRVPIAGSGFNKQMKRVLEDETERVNFWFYNNGLTAICDHFDSPRPLDAEDVELSSIRAEKMQIVNGCQTCFTVFSYAKDIDDVRKANESLSSQSVLIRLIEAKKEASKDPNFGHKIARYTNSQTPITHRDLRATEPEQGHLKEVFEKDWKYFLEVKKGEWSRRLDRDPSFKVKFDEPFVFSNERSAQAYIAFWQNQPAFAKASKKKIFAEEALYQSIFGRETPPELLLFSAQLRELEEYWRLKRGYKLKIHGETRHWSVSKAEVMKNGELYVLSIIGYSLKNAWNASRPKDVPEHVLKACCKNLHELLPRYDDPPKGRVQHVRNAMDEAFDDALKVLSEFVKGECDRDPELTVRNFMIRPATWDDLQKSCREPMKKIGKVLVPILETMP